MKELIRRAREWDGDAFVELMEMHKQAMYKVARSYLDRDADVADAISDTILDCFLHLQSLKEPKYFKTWLIRILINNCKDIRRKNLSVVQVEDTACFAEREAGDDDREFIRLLEPLDEETRMIMVLHYAQGFHTREIAELMGMKESTVKSRILRARRKLKEEFFPAVAQ